MLCFFGDGASCEGEFFETLNMAQLWKVPLVFVCENNGMAISVPTSKSQATPDIADRARGFGMPAAIVDGNDVLAVRAAVAEGVERARAGGRPDVRRVQDRPLGAPLRVLRRRQRPGGERRAWQRVDPIPRFRKALVAWGVATEAELDAIDAERRARRCARSARRPRRAVPGARVGLRGHLRAVGAPGGRRQAGSVGSTVSNDHPRARRRASMREVAERAGVAMSSVSRVLSGHPDVSPAMSEKVMRGRRASSTTSRTSWRRACAGERRSASVSWSATSRTR